MKINRAFIKGTNWALAGLIGMLGFSGCEKENLEVEYGAPYANYTVKGSVVNKATGKPIEGIRVAYGPEPTVAPMYGVIPAPFQPKDYVMTDTKGEFKLTTNSFLIPDQTTVYVDDIDGEKNGLYQSEIFRVDFSEAEQIEKSKGWYEGEYAVTAKVELTEIENQ